MIRIKIPENFFEKKLEKAKKIKVWIDKQWELCEKGEKDCDTVNYITSVAENAFLEHNLSVFSFIKIFDRETKRAKNQKYNVSKIVISKEDENKFQEYDRKLYSIFKGDFYTEEKIRKDISMFHLMNGFRRKDIDSGFIFLEDDCLQDKE